MNRVSPPLFNVAVLAAASLALLAIGAADYATGPDIAFALFYLAVVAMAGWATSAVWVPLASAVIGAALWFAAEWLSAGPSPVGVAVWNGATRLVIFAVVGALISRLRAALDAAQALARTDHLTGALNARAFDEIAKAEVSRARRYAHPLTVAYIDLDDFKAVNDRFGHSRGDAVLKTVSAALASSLRRSDSICRVGGDEFAVLLPETGREQAEQVMAKLRDALAEAMHGLEVGVTFSMGAAVFDVPPADVDALIRAADALMYEAKAQGKNRFGVGVQQPAIGPAR